MVETLADRYELGEELGAGGMGRVVRAHDRLLGRTVAVKLMHEHLARQPSVRERFMREARSAVRFSHPNAVAVYDAGTEGRTPYIVMEFVDGVTLEDGLADGPLDSGRAVRIAMDVLDALAAAHANGIVHRDLKPANIMLLRTGPGGNGDDGTRQAEAVKLTDFGIAKGLTEAGERKLTATGQVFGTPYYLAPEQADGQTATPASDVYAMGVVLYEMLTGSPPFTGESPFAVVIAHQHDEPPPVRRGRRDIDPALAAVVHRALNKNPRDRYSNAGQMRAALAELSRVRTPQRGAKQSPRAAAAAPASSSRPPSRPRTAPGAAAAAPTPATSRMVWWVAALAVLAVLAVAGVALVSAVSDAVGGAMDLFGGGAPVEAPAEPGGGEQQPEEPAGADGGQSRPSEPAAPEDDQQSSPDAE